MAPLIPHDPRTPNTSVLFTTAATTAARRDTIMGYLHWWHSALVRCAGIAAQLVSRSVYGAHIVHCTTVHTVQVSLAPVSAGAPWARGLDGHPLRHRRYRYAASISRAVLLHRFRHVTL